MTRSLNAARALQSFLGGCRGHSPLHEQTREAGRLHLHSLAAVVCACTLALVTLGCQSQEKVVRYKPFFTGIAGAEFGGQEPVRPTVAARRDPTAVEENAEVIRVNPDKTKALDLRSPRQTMMALERLLDEEDDETIWTQLLSSVTIEELQQRGYTRQQYLDHLYENRREIAKTFARMPLGHNTPTVITEKPEPKVWIMRLTGTATKDMRFTRVWVRLEEGQWRLRWID